MYNDYAMGEVELLRQTFTKVIDLSGREPLSVQERYDRAIAYELMEKYAAALKEYEVIIQLDPTFFIAYLSAARLLVQFERLEEAKALYTTADHLAAGDPIRQVEVALGRGQLYERRGDTDAAMHAYQRVIELDKDHTVDSVYYHLAKLYAKTGDRDKAIHSYLTFIEESEVKSWAHDVFANYLFEIGEYAWAIEEFGMALSYPIDNDALLHARLGMVYAAVDEQSFPNKESLARTEFDQALQHPGAAEAYIRAEYGRILAEFGYIDEAIDQYEQSLQVDKSLAVVTRRSLGQLYEEVKNFDKAIEMYQSLMNLCAQTPDDQIVHLEFAYNRLRSLGVEPLECSKLSIPVG
jgi:tetratricopeptide (TPR) repeat protein